MHAFLTSVNPEFIEGPDVLIIHPDPSIGIEEVRAIQHFLSRKPSQSNQNTVIIHNADKLTLPAQHALLKTLEEPPGNSQIYLLTTQPDSLLPTILSRVQMTNTVVIPSAVEGSLSPLIKSFFSAGVGERLKILDSQNFNRESALKFLDELEYIIHSDLSLAHYYPLIPDTRKYLKANCNVKLTLDHLALYS